MHYSMVKPPGSNFMVITSNFSGVRIFRIFTVPGMSVFSFSEVLAVLKDLDETSKRKLEILEHFVVGWLFL